MGTHFARITNLIEKLDIGDYRLNVSYYQGYSYYSLACNQADAQKCVKELRKYYLVNDPMETTFGNRVRCVMLILVMG